MRHYAPEAARQAAALGAHREAAAHYRTALDHAPADDLEARATLSEGRAYECYLVNQFDDAVEAQETALDLRRQQDDLLKVGDNLCWLSRLAFIRGRGQDARKLAKEAVQILEQLPPGPELAMAYSAMSQLHMLAEDGLAAVEWGQRALQIAEPLGLTETVVHALNNVGTAELHMGDPAGARSSSAASSSRLPMGCTSMPVGPISTSPTKRSLFATMIVSDSCCPTASATPESVTSIVDLYALTERSRAHLEQGLWREAEEDASAVLRAAPAAISRLVAVVVLGCVRMRRGDQGAGPLLDEARERAWATGDIMRIGPVAAARVEAAWLEGDIEGARRCRRCLRAGPAPPGAGRWGSSACGCGAPARLTEPSESMALPIGWRSAATGRGPPMPGAGEVVPTRRPWPWRAATGRRSCGRWTS